MCVCIYIYIYIYIHIYMIYTYAHMYTGHKLEVYNHASVRPQFGEHLGTRERSASTPSLKQRVL